MLLLLMLALLLGGLLLCQRLARLLRALLHPRELLLRLLALLRMPMRLRTLALQPNHPDVALTTEMSVSYSTAHRVK